MTKNALPTYAIVELLIRLSNIDPHIGDYKGHVNYDDGVIAKTTGGTITFSKAIIKQQFDAPELITQTELRVLAKLFTATGSKAK